MLADCLAEDRDARLYGGRYAYDGGDAFVSSLREPIGKPTFLTMHHGHRPELTLVSADHACDVRFLEDHAINPEDNYLMHGTALCDDQYVKRDGVWRIHATRHERLFETVTSPIPPSFTLAANRFAPGAHGAHSAHGAAVTTS